MRTDRPADFDVRNATLSVRSGATWVPYTPMLTSGAGLVVSWQTPDRPFATVRAFRCRSSVPPGPRYTSSCRNVERASTITARWFAPHGSVIETRRTSMAPTARPVASTPRGSLLTSQPNLGGQSAATSASAMLASGGPLLAASTTLFAAAFAVLRTESRSAWLTPRSDPLSRSSCGSDRLDHQVAGAGWWQRHLDSRPSPSFLGSPCSGSMPTTSDTATGRPPGPCLSKPCASTPGTGTSPAEFTSPRSRGRPIRP